MEILFDTSIGCDRTNLLITLCQAASNAIKSGHHVLASFTQPIKAYDPLFIFKAFRQLALGETFFWEKPEEQKSFIGTGTATTIETNGAHCFNRVAAAWRMLQSDAVIRSAPEQSSVHGTSPILFGGFAFDPLSPRTQLWEDFPGGLLVLASLLFTSSTSGTTLTMSTLVGPSDNVEQRVDEISTNILHLYAMLEKLTIQQKTISLRSSDAPRSQQLSNYDLIPPSAWKALVADAVQKIQNGAYEKVVLARGMQVNCDDPFDIEATLSRLRANHPRAYVFAIQRGQRYFVGATPERLVYASDGQIRTMALAGSAPRGKTEEEDRDIGMRLLHSEKNRQEHTIVVTMVHNALKHLCSMVGVTDTPELLQLQNIQHLQTPIVGELLSEHSILEALHDLHPTPAVGGFPREAALTEIRDNERLDRGWYSGPVGWVDANGYGEFAVALRSALVEDNTATLFAGCGIVADSNPESEYIESCLKLTVMLQALSPDKEQKGMRNPIHD